MTEKTSVMFTAGKLAAELGISPGKVKKLIEAHKIEPDEIKRNCKYYGPKTLQSLKATLEDG